MKNWLGLFILITGVMFGAASGSAQDAAMIMPVDAQPLRILSASGEQRFALEVANTDEKRSRGLMYRTDFPADRAMIFVFEKVQPVMMWMANTPLPLDMLFVAADGKIARVADNTTPFSEDIIASGEPVAFAIELNSGTAARLSIKAGDQVKHPIICGTCQ